MAWPRPLPPKPDLDPGEWRRRATRSAYGHNFWAIQTSDCSCGRRQHRYRTQKTLEITSDTALWYRPGTPPRPVRWVLVRGPEGKRNPQAFFSTDVALDPADIIALFVRRWQVEVTFAETRAHLGVETQRQWSDTAISRTKPALLGLYSLMALWACDLLTTSSVPYAAAWYRKTNLTFTDAIGAVRLALWVGDIYSHSPHHREQQKTPPDRIVRMAEALCFAA